MTLGALLTIVGVIVAIYALARPSQRKSIGLFIPLRVIIVALSISGFFLLSLEVLVQWEIKTPGWKFAFGTVAFLLPIGVTAWAVLSWCRAKLTKKSEPKFKDFLFSCLRDGVYDEAVRILTQNRDYLAEILTKDTADLVFDRQFIHAMVSARSWLHLELLTDEVLLQTLPNYHRAVDRTVRELLDAENSPLRTSALLDEGGDETIYCTNEEDTLIHRTFLNPRWYHRCRAGYPLVIAACERIDSGGLDDVYNRPDARYGARQGITPRSKCPVFLAEKTIAHALKAAITQNNGTTENTHCDAANLWDIFQTIYYHSVYRPETWDEPSGYGDYPTPFGFLLAEILSDYYFICNDAWHASDYGKNMPSDILAPVIRMWAHCVMWLTKDEGHVSPRFRRSSVYTLLEMVLERRQSETHAKDHQKARAAWTQVFVENIKDAMTSWLPDSRHYLGEVLEGMDLAKDYICENRDWLRQELGINGNGGGIHEQ